MKVGTIIISDPHTHVTINIISYRYNANMFFEC
jgi:hypothetical protein